MSLRMELSIGVSALLVGLGVFAVPAGATSITVPNYDFTMPGQSGGSYSIDDITDWSGADGQYGVQSLGSGQYSVPIPSGSQFAYTNHGYIYLNTNTDSAFTQTIQAGTYVLTAEVGNRLDYGFGGSAVIGIWAGLGTADAYQFQSAPTAGTWTNVTLTDVVSASDPNIGQLLTILLSSEQTTFGPGGGEQVDFNDITLTYTPPGGDPPAGVPEPLTLSVFGAGLAGAAGMRRRKAKRA